jgi:endonuclease-8
VPEGDSIHSIAVALAPVLVGEALERVWVRDVGDVPRLVGKSVDEVEAVGKHLLVGIGGEAVLRIHLGMRGRVRRWEPDRVFMHWDTSAILATAEHAFVWRAAKTVELVRKRERDALRALEFVGPDLIAPECDLDEVVARARAGAEPDALLVDVLLDQRIAAGIGNVYKSEVLFLVGVHPRATLVDVDDATLHRLYELARELLRANVGSGHRDTISAIDPRTRVHPNERRWVYRRRERPCRRCGTKIEMLRLGRDARSTYHCPSCQSGSTS